MKRCVTVTAMVIIAAVTATAVAQTRALEKHGETMIEGRPFLSDFRLNNGYDLAGSPLGVFEAEGVERRFSVDLGYRYLGLGDDAKNDLSGQSVTMGDEGRSYIRVFYGPDILSRETENGSALADADVTLHRFGFTAAGVASQYSRFALSGKGYFGKQSLEGSPDSSRQRLLAGVERLRLDVGAAPTFLIGGEMRAPVRVGFYGDATLRVDTLLPPKGVSSDDKREFAVQTNLPEIGGYVDFGYEGFPVRSSFNMSHSWSRFTYGARDRRSGNNLGNVPSDVNGKGDAYAIINDSLQLHWVTHGRIPLMDEQYVIKPGLLIGITTNSGAMHHPDNDDNSPMKIGDAVDGKTYDLDGFYFGIGAGAEIQKYADAHIEYLMASMSLDCGSGFGDPAVKARTLHHVTLGVSSPLNKFIDLPIEITPRLAYFASGAAGIIPPRHSNVDPLNNTPGKSMRYLYEPENFLSGFVRTTGFTIGIDGKAIPISDEEGNVRRHLLSVSYWMTFLSRSIAPKSGMELGLSAILSL